MKRQILFLTAAIAAIGGMSATAISGGSISERRAKALAAYEPAGEPVDCVTLSQVRSSRVIDDRTIDFTLAGARCIVTPCLIVAPALPAKSAFRTAPA